MVSVSNSLIITSATSLMGDPAGLYCTRTVHEAPITYVLYVRTYVGMYCIGTGLG